VDEGNVVEESVGEDLGDVPRWDEGTMGRTSGTGGLWADSRIESSSLQDGWRSR
jgi:hypothetical protein